MGFIDSSTHPTLYYFYNVTLGVGNNCANTPDDVKLVQYMLKKYYEAAPPHVERPVRPLEVTGVCDPLTYLAIVLYQDHISTDAGEGAITIDGRVDRVLNKTTFKGELTGTNYTLFWLNQNLKHVNPVAYIRLPAFVPVRDPVS